MSSPRLHQYVLPKPLTNNRVIFSTISDIPLARLVANPSTCMGELSSPTFSTIAVVCRLGNDSQIAMDILQEHYKATSDDARSECLGISDEVPQDRYKIVDLIGGLRRWSAEVDPSFPVY